MPLPPVFVFFPHSSLSLRYVAASPAISRGCAGGGFGEGYSGRTHGNLVFVVVVVYKVAGSLPRWKSFSSQLLLELFGLGVPWASKCSMSSCSLDVRTLGQCALALALAPAPELFGLGGLGHLTGWSPGGIGCHHISAPMGRGLFWAHKR